MIAKRAQIFHASNFPMLLFGSQRRKRIRPLILRSKRVYKRSNLRKTKLLLILFFFLHRKYTQRTLKRPQTFLAFANCIRVGPPPPLSFLLRKRLLYYKIRRLSVSICHRFFEPMTAHAIPWIMARTPTMPRTTAPKPAHPLSMF